MYICVFCCNILFFRRCRSASPTRWRLWDTQQIESKRRRNIRLLVPRPEESFLRLDDGLEEDKIQPPHDTRRFIHVCRLMHVLADLAGACRSGAVHAAWGGVGGSGHRGLRSAAELSMQQCKHFSANLCSCTSASQAGMQILLRVR